MSFSVRPIDANDHGAINALHRSVGWPTRSLTGWDWLAGNPARLETKAPAGWLLEAEDGEPCGLTGNFVQRFHHGGGMLHGATGFSIIVTPRARGRSVKLLTTFTKQTDLFALYTFNANPASSPLYKRHGLVAWPPETHDVKLSWRIDPFACAGGRLWREIDRHAPRLTQARSERLLNPRLHDPDRLDLPEEVTVLTDLADGSRYADFWETLKAEGRLIADRSPAMLRWRLADPDLTLRPLMLAFNRGATIGGYAMAMMSKGNPIEPPMLEIVDLVALEDEPRAIPALIHALLANARRLGAAKLRIQTVSPTLLRRMGPLADTARREGGWGHCHVKFDPETPGVETWSPTPFDGDYGICLRPVPVAAEHRRAA
ncbi:N-acetyltransferase [Brevundimonas sp.]|uniref:N-acetyltransferase n=1 Tax=Brevundimonas sp. TaxID=1871086 RepID=UPI00286C8052|nr:N-acetyltransferase [Brevundimonas sp.]